MLETFQFNINIYVCVSTHMCVLDMVYQGSVGYIRIYTAMQEFYFFVDFHNFFFKFLFVFQLIYDVILVSGVEFSDSSLSYNTQCSPQQVPSIRITHPAHPWPTSLSQPLVCSLLLRVSYGLLPSLLFSFPFPMFTFCFLNSRYE